ncbi:MAG TPA: hypothetical protein DDZ81_05720 [Acetobacteraceae bacterium]|jgi:TPR repeat protein|nr:hypothetical protein [Acetobacteraceae bacterium]
MRLLLWLLLAGATAGPAASAEKPNFAELLARAEAQAAAGHRWSPPGDNMTETVAGMMDLISTATPQQLAELSALLEKGGSHPPPSVTPGHPVPEAPPRPDAKPSPQPGARSAELLSRGKEAERLGDVSGARRFYASAAALGNAAAALSLGRLYDPAYLKHTALGGIDPDPALARHWYERAAALGNAEAGPLLQALSVR